MILTLTMHHIASSCLTQPQTICIISITEKGFTYWLTREKHNNNKEINCFTVEAL